MVPFKSRQVEVHWRSLHGAAWQQFVGEVFRRKGYWVKEVHGDRDDGIDLIATYDDERIGIQCKGGVDSVGVAAVQQALAGQAIHSCNRAAVVTNGAFSEEARQLASSIGCWLVDATEFAQMSGDHHLVVQHKAESFLAKLCVGVWNLLVRLFGMTLAIAVLALGVLVIAVLIVFLVSQLDLASPSHQEIDIADLQPAASESPQQMSPPAAKAADELPQSTSSPANDSPAAAEPVESTYEATRPKRAEQPRRWESADGRFSVMAIYVGYEDGEVTLRRTEDNELITVRLNRLSQKDKKTVTARIRRDRFEERIKGQE